jgi:hypothetical protein
VTRPSVTRAILGGFTGTLAMTMMMYLIAPMMGVKMDIAGSLAGMLGVPWAVGLVMHFLNGSVIFPLSYALVLFRRLKGEPVIRGITWGAVLWLMAQLLVMPMIGAGVFSSRMGGIMAVVASLMAHVVYGALLGRISGTATAVGNPVSTARA